MSDLIDVALERINYGCDLSERYYDQPLMITYSGGKDSDAILELAIMSGRKIEVVHSHTTADAPETVRYVRKRFRDLELRGVDCKIAYPTYKGQRTSMWSLIPQKQIPPTRLARYCCAVLKETSGRNRAIATGVRWAESIKRSGRGEIEALGNKLSDKIILNSDNDNRRRFFDRCDMQDKIAINPIIDWQNADVWNFLQDRKCASNPLYQCGFHRVGCIGCPMAGNKRHDEFRQYPRYKDLYIHAFDRMLEERKTADKGDAGTRWRDAESVFAWWMEDKNLDGQEKWDV